MDLNFIISFIIGFIVAIIFSLEKVRLKFIKISLNILLKLNKRKKDKLLKKVLFSKNLKEKVKAAEELTKTESLLNYKKLAYNAIKLIAIYAIITLAILLAIWYIISSIFKSTFGYILGWFIGFIIMIIKNKLI